jgi:hypothetical protein
MSDIQFSPEAAERLLATGVRQQALANAEELKFANHNAVSELDGHLTTISRLPFGKLLLCSAEFLIPYDPVLGIDEERYSVGTSFAYGGSFMFRAIEQSNLPLMGSINRYIRSAYGREPDIEVNYDQDKYNLAEELHEIASNIQAMGSAGLISLGIENELEEVEEIVVSDVKDQQYFRIGAGWTIYQAVLADLDGLEKEANITEGADWDKAFAELLREA